MKIILPAAMPDIFTGVTASGFAYTTLVCGRNDSCNLRDRLDGH
ncbi:MAG: hypothetical protein U5K84_05900 [Alkalibacterium sp.]|nr:hypothetical protein [Alkalibacterium sp.]